MTAIKDLEAVESAAGDIRKLLKEITEDLENPQAATPESHSPPPAPIVEADTAMSLSLPATAPPKEANPTASVTLSSPDRPRKSSTSSPTTSTSSPSSAGSHVPAWQQKLLAKKRLDENLTPAKKPAGSEAPARWAVPKSETKVTATNATDNITLTLNLGGKGSNDTPQSTEPKKEEEPIEVSLAPPPKKAEEIKRETSSASHKSPSSNSKMYSGGTAPSSSSEKRSSLHGSSVPTPAAKVNESGTPLAPSLQKNIGQMAAVKTLAVDVGATPAAIEKCREAGHSSTIRYVILKLEKEQVDLVSSGDSQGNAGADFERLKSAVNEKEPAYIFFRYKDSGSAPWALISWLPESTPVKTRMVYASSVVSTCVLIGADSVSKQAAINNVVCLSSSFSQKSRNSLSGTISIKKRSS